MILGQWFWKIGGGFGSFKVSLDVSIDSDEQLWAIGPVNEEGYCTIQNESGKFLTAASISTTLVTGDLNWFRVSEKMC